MSEESIVKQDLYPSAAQTDCTIGYVAMLARFPAGRILLHLIAMVRDRCVRFHTAGIRREIATIVAEPVPRARFRARLIGRLVRYLGRPKQRPRCGGKDRCAIACGDSSSWRRSAERRQARDWRPS